MRTPALLLLSIAAAVSATHPLAQAPDPSSPPSSPPSPPPSSAPSIPPSASPPPTPAQPIVVQQVSCRGEEPFWQLDASRTTGVLQRTGGKARQVVEFRGELIAVAAVAPASFVWRGNSTHLPNDTIVAVLREEACRPAKADAPAPSWRGIVSVRAGETLAGCCTVVRGYDAGKAPLAAFATKAQDDWSRRYPDLAASIQRCVNDGGVTVREVAKAWSVDANAVSVRLVATDGKPWTCTVETNARTRPRMARVGDGEPPLPGANMPVYYPPREAPIVACGRLERIAGPGARARTEGWLHYYRC